MQSSFPITCPTVMNRPINRVDRRYSPIRLTGCLDSYILNGSVSPAAGGGGGDPKRTEFWKSWSKNLADPPRSVIKSSYIMSSIEKSDDDSFPSNMGGWYGTLSSVWFGTGFPKEKPVEFTRKSMGENPSG